MNLSRYIALRTAADNRASQNIMVHIATAAVAVSIIVVMISLSVMKGFRQEITSLVSSTISDVTVTDFRSMRQPEAHPVTEDKALHDIITTTEFIERVEPYALRGAVLRSEKGAIGVMLRGVDSVADISHYTERIVTGRAPRLNAQRYKEILLSESKAATLGIGNEARIEILLVDGEEPRREVFKVCGIYRSALGDLGAEVAITDIRNVRKLNGWSDNQITGYACYIEDSEFAPTIASVINLRLLQEYEGTQGNESVSAMSAQDAYSSIFGWLETHDVNATVILTIMLIVAIFNTMTALLILVFECTRMIGTLKSLGMNNRSIRKIFTYRAAIIVTRGVVIGSVVALGLLLLQRHLHLIKLDETGYFLSEVPVSFGAGWMVGVDLLFIAVILIVIHLATAIVSRIQVAEAIKYE